MANEIELELTPSLKETEVVSSFIFYTKTDAIQLLLNHQYEQKSVIVTIDKRDWNKTHDVVNNLMMDEDSAEYFIRRAYCKII